jgi:thymidine kinase
MGPMFAGKSTELLRRVKRFEIAGKKTLSIKYSADTRYSKDAISTHDLQIKLAFACKKLSDISDHDWSCFDVIGIDEGQFFEDLVSFSEKASNMGKIILISALNSTFERKGWN